MPPTVYLLYGDDGLAISGVVGRGRVIFAGVAHAGLEGPRAQAFFALLESLPPSTALALLQVLDPQEAKSSDRPAKLQPLIEWVSRHPNSAFVCLFRTPSGPAFVDWLRQRCARMGGEIGPRAG